MDALGLGQEGLQAGRVSALPEHSPRENSSLPRWLHSSQENKANEIKATLPNHIS